MSSPSSGGVVRRLAGRVVLLFAPVIVISGAFLVYFTIFGHVAPSGPTGSGGQSADAVPNEYTCPVTIAPELQRALSQDYAKDFWSLYKYEVGSPAPRIGIAAGSDDLSACAIKIDRAIEEPGRQMDWRLGHILPLGEDVAPMNIEAVVTLSATGDIEVDTASVYLASDGASSGVGVHEIGETAREYRMSMTSKGDGTPMEFWIRLAAGHGIISPAGETMFLSVTLRLAAPSP